MKLGKTAMIAGLNLEHGEETTVDELFQRIGQVSWSERDFPVYSLPKWCDSKRVWPPYPYSNGTSTSNPKQEEGGCSKWMILSKDR